MKTYYENALPFRGLLPDVRNSTNIQHDAGLDWTVVSRPVQVVGKYENRVAPGYQALVRNDPKDSLTEYHGTTLDIVSDRFKPHQNSEILADMTELAAAGEAEILYAGSLDEGRKVVAIAKLEGSFDLGGSFPDHNALFAVISGGHKVGTPFKLKSMAFRLVCLNGSFFTKSGSATFTVSHRTGLRGELMHVRSTFEAIKREFSRYGETADRLRQTPMDREQSRLLVAEILRPGTAAELGRRLGENPLQAHEIWGEVADSLRGRVTLSEMLKESETRQDKVLLEAIETQAGAAGENLWNGFNGITWHVDHQRGASQETGVNGALFGQGASLKERALEVAKGFANRI